MRIVVHTVVLMVLTVGGAAHAEGKSKRSVCQVDADCALVPSDCCDCNHGGAQIAIPTREKARYQQKRQARCADSMCAAVMSQDASCAATTAVCKEGQCTLGPAR